LQGKAEIDGYSIIPVQDEKDKGDADPHMLQILKEIQETLDGWLRKLNNRIEREDVTRLGVRFLEMIRNILEWIKEKVDAKIESYEKGKPIQKERKGVFRETNQEVLRFSNMG
jgi:predicted  nucleic acid-binding Zn-ribbon protein